MKSRVSRRKNSPWLVLIVASLGLGITPIPTAVAQTSPPLSTEQFWQSEEAIRLHVEAETLFLEGKYTEAVATQKKSLAIFEELLPPNHPNIANAHKNLGVFYQAQGNYDKAEEHYLRDVAIIEEGEHPIFAKIEK